LFVLVAEQS